MFLFFIRVTTSNFSVVVKYLNSQVIQSILPGTADKHQSEFIIAILRFSLYFDVGHRCELVPDPTAQPFTAACIKCIAVLCNQQKSSVR